MAKDGRDQRRGNRDSGSHTESGKKTRNNPRIVSRNVSIESRRFAKRICRHLASTLDSLDAMEHAAVGERGKETIPWTVTRHILSPIWRIRRKVRPVSWEFSWPEISERESGQRRKHLSAAKKIECTKTKAGR